MGWHLQPAMDARIDLHSYFGAYLPCVGRYARHLDGLHQASSFALGPAHFHYGLVAVLHGLGGSGSLEILIDDTLFSSPSPL